MNQANKNVGSVLLPWTESLTFMQQSVLIAAVRGPDGIRKDHPVKVLCRWLRRSFLKSAFDGGELATPYEKGGGSFTGPASTSECEGLGAAVDYYFRTVDELPHHFQLHLMHAAEILGYKHPTEYTREFWHKFYLACVNDMHLFPESEELMDLRLGDTEAGWRAREEVIAK